MLATSHGKRSKSDRKAKRVPSGKGKIPIKTESYNATDDTVTAVYVDIANGMSRSDCLEKIQQGLYGNKPVKARQSAYIYNAALDRFAVDCDVEAERLRDVFYGRYESIFQQCIDNNDMYNARATLTDMARIFGIEKKAPDTAIMINSDKEGGVTVNFGFDKKDEN